MSNLKKRTFAVKTLSRVASAANTAAARTHAVLRRRELADASATAALSIHTHMTAKELDVLYRLALDVQPGGRVLEVGSYLGASSCHLAAALSRHDGHLYCVDTWGNETMPDGVRDTFEEFRRNTAGVAASITMIRKRSHDLVAGDVQLPLDLIFIDADHSYRAVKRDVAIVSGWLRDGGVMAFHDATFFEGVSRVIGETLATGKWQLMGHLDNLLWMRKLGSSGAFPNAMTAAERAEENMSG